jgi:hypothetical protein
MELAYIREIVNLIFITIRKPRIRPWGFVALMVGGGGGVVVMNEFSVESL